MYIFKNCKGFIRTVPLLVYDDHKVEDIDTSMEDHCADEARYMCMARPIKPRMPEHEDAYRNSTLNLFLDIPKEDIITKPKMERMEVIE